jgi:hypothetical protein
MFLQQRSKGAPISGPLVKERLEAKGDTDPAHLMLIKIKLLYYVERPKIS